MTKEQIQKHKEVIKWFCDNPDRGVWELTSIGWELTLEPSFYPADKYVQNDEYVEFRKAIMDGRNIECKFNTSDDKWQIIDKRPTDEFYHTFNYRVKPNRPEFKIGDWVKHYDKDDKLSIFQITETSDCDDGLLLYHKDGCILYHKDDTKLWNPRKGELCVFWDTNNEMRSDYWVIGKFHSTCTEKYYQDHNNNKWDNIAPLEFIQTLKN